MEFKTFVRKPFTVEAVEVTKENIAEIASQIGVLQYKDDGSPYISVNRMVIPNLYKVYPGFWFTRVGDNHFRCYTKRIFKQQFIESNPDIENWINYLNSDQPLITNSEEELEDAGIVE